MDSGLLSTLKSVKLTSHKRRCTDNDFVDRLNGFYTPMIITILTIVICTKSYIVGSPLQCWVPPEFSKGWESFAESYCFIKNTYYVPRSHELPSSLNDRRSAELQYYQWVPFVLGLQAVLFLVPGLFWRFANWQGKIHIKPIIERSVVSCMEIGNTKSATLRSVADHIRSSLCRSKVFMDGATLGNKIENQNTKFCGFFNAGFYLTFCYLWGKILAVINLIIQFLIVRSFLKVDFLFGINLISKLMNGSDWEDTGVFPRVTMCDFNINQVSQPLSYTMQCVLVINLFNEKIYIFLWFWFALLLVITVANLAIWLFRMMFQRQIKAFLSRKSTYHSNVARYQELLTCQSETTMDVFLVLRLIDENCGLLTARKVVENLLEHYAVAESSGEDVQSPPPDYHDAVENLYDADYSSES